MPETNMNANIGCKLILYGLRKYNTMFKNN